VYCEPHLSCYPCQTAGCSTGPLRNKSKGHVGLGEAMRNLLGALFLVAGLLILSHNAGACGDKLLILGRPMRFNSRPAVVLAYAPAGSTLESVLNTPQWTNAISKGKHRLRVIQTPGQLVQTLKTERFDIVVLSLTDASIFQAQLGPSSFPTVFVPMVETVERNAVRNAEKEYGVAMKSVAKTSDYLSAIDRAVGLRDLRAEAAARVKKNQAKSS
jgi:hypothetical protein